jgi:hypothetical protein
VAEHLALGLGIQGTLDFAPASAKAAYGSRPAGYMPFVRLKIR